MKKNVLDIAPQLAYYLLDDVETSVFDSVDLPDSAKHRIGRYYEHFGLLHDSWILKTTVTPQNFQISLNDFTTHVFAEALVLKKRLNIKDERLVFKIDIEFEIQAVTFNTVDDDGLLDEIKPINVNEYLYEQVISVTDSLIDIGLIAWVSSQKRKPGKHILILVRANSISLNDHRDRDWESIFSNDYDIYYTRFKAELSAGRYLSDQSLCNILIDEIDGELINHD